MLFMPIFQALKVNDLYSYTTHKRYSMDTTAYALLKLVYHIIFYSESV